MQKLFLFFLLCILLFFSGCSETSDLDDTPMTEEQKSLQPLVQEATVFMQGKSEQLILPGMKQRTKNSRQKISRKISNCLYCGKNLRLSMTERNRQ